MGRMARRRRGFTLVEVAAAAGLLAVTTLTFATAVTGAVRLETQTRERTWARMAAQQKLEQLSALSSEDLQKNHAGPIDFPVSFDLNGDGTTARGERLLPAPASSETPPRTEAGRITVDFSYPSVAQVTVSVRWRSVSGKPGELKLRVNLALER